MAKINYGTKIEFLGGNNEDRIGANSILIEHGEQNSKTKRIMIDAGSLFTPEWTNYDAAIVDMSKYFENPYEKVESPVDALFITHCHEDHIGALVYLAAAKYKLPTIYAGAYTKDFIIDQMHKNNIPEEYIPEVITVNQGQTIEVADNFKVSPFYVSHSTAGALGFHVLTETNGKANAGLLFSGDYHLDKVPFGKGFDEDEYVKFIKDKFISHIFTDSTSATMSADQTVTFDQAVANTVRELRKNEQKQVFSPVIARSVQNLAVDLKAAKETGRTVLIASSGLRQSFEILKSRLKDNDPEILKIFAVEDGQSFDIDELVHVANSTADIQKYLNKYEPSQRYMIISGAFAEDKAGRKSCLVLISEQSKVSYDAKGKVKGKGMSGHPIFTADENTLFLLRQRPIESINGQKHRELVGRLLALGTTVVLNGDTPDQKYQRSGHANKSEAQKLYDLTVQNCINADKLAKGNQKLFFISVHGDIDQLQAQNDMFEHQKDTKVFLCLNTDAIKVSEGKTEKIRGISFEDQPWICVEKHSLSGHGVDDIFIFDLCDKNFVKIDNLYTVVNVSTKANPHAHKENDYRLGKALETALKLEEEGVRMSNIEIRNRVRGDKRGLHTESYSYQQIKSIRDEKPKSKQNKKFIRRGRGGR